MTEDCEGKRISHLPGEHPECVHVAGLRDSDGRVSSGFLGADYFWSDTTEEAHGVPRPQIRTRDHEGRVEARDARGTIGVDQDVMLRERESGDVLAVQN